MSHRKHSKLLCLQGHSVLMYDNIAYPHVLIIGFHLDDQRLLGEDILEYKLGEAEPGVPGLKEVWDQMKK